MDLKTKKKSEEDNKFLQKRNVKLICVTVDSHNLHYSHVRGFMSKVLCRYITWDCRTLNRHGLLINNQFRSENYP